MHSSLAIYWNKPRESDDGHPWMSELCDMVFSPEPVGSTVEFRVDRLLKCEEEEKKR